MLAGLRPVPHQAAFFGTGIVEKVGGYSTDFAIAADQLFMAEAAGIARPLQLTDTIAAFDGTGRSVHQPLHDHFTAMREITRRTQPRGSALRATSFALSYVVEVYRNAQQLGRGPGR